MGCFSLPAVGASGWRICEHAIQPQAHLRKRCKQATWQQSPAAAVPGWWPCKQMEQQRDTAVAAKYRSPPTRAAGATSCWQQLPTQKRMVLGHTPQLHL